jgi:hypothetical protein
VTAEGDAAEGPVIPLRVKSLTTLAPLLAPLDRVECHHALFPYHCNEPSEKKNVHASVQQRIADLAALEGQADIIVREAEDGAAKDAAKATYGRVYTLLHISVALINSASGHHKEQRRLLALLSENIAGWVAVCVTYIEDRRRRRVQEAKARGCSHARW